MHSKDNKLNPRRASWTKAARDEREFITAGSRIFLFEGVDWEGQYDKEMEQDHF